MESFVSCGIPYLDETVGGFCLGDNVVWALESGSYFDLFLQCFLTRKDTRKFKVIYVSFDFPPKKILSRYGKLLRKDDFVLVDAFTYGKGKGDEYFRSFYQHRPPGNKAFRISCIKNLAEPTEFITTLSGIQDDFKDSHACKYVFGSLTGMQELWGESNALHFFTYTCPKLFELKALAYWPLVQEAHSKAFLATISYITQIVFNLGFQEEHACSVRILKTERQPSRVLHVAHCFTVQDETICFVPLPGDADARRGAAALETNRVEITACVSEREPSRIGTRIRHCRAEKRLSQAELARILHITPSALSQIENNHTLPSLTLFVDIARFFNTSLDSLVAPEPAPVRPPRTRE